MTKSEVTEQDKQEGWSEYKALLCDLGEGKFIGNQVSTGGNPYSPKRYRAPELNSGKPYTLKCDIYSFGVITGELLKTAADGGSGRVPKKLMDIYERCTRENPDERPERILDIVFELEHLHSDELMEGKMELGDFFEFEKNLQGARLRDTEHQKPDGNGTTVSYVKPESGWTS